MYNLKQSSSNQHFGWTCWRMLSNDVDYQRSRHFVVTCLFELRVSFKTYHDDTVEVGVSFIPRNSSELVPNFLSSFPGANKNYQQSLGQCWTDFIISHPKEIATLVSTIIWVVLSFLCILLPLHSFRKWSNLTCVYVLTRWWTSHQLVMLVHPRI